ncbi:hypothetical protein ACFYXS_02970 [Streptomyces sp. NPDC002574]|uniref:hypothetical protein n=1 Tax=Streptomyces sp. NPDC002574 TaxID=3364652 RepID=UPI0036CB4C8D
MSARKKMALAALCAIVLGAGGAVVNAQVSKGDMAVVAPKESGESVTNMASHALQGCADSWNLGNDNKASVGSIATAAQNAGSASAYVNVAFSAAFPDLCMITVANPATSSAQQYVQEPGNAWSIAPDWRGAVSQLDSSGLTWNGRMGQDGTIVIL